MLKPTAVVLTLLSVGRIFYGDFGMVYGMNYLMVENNMELEFFRNPEVDFMTVLTALLFLIACGALSGLIPAVQAVRINPVTAMKS